MLLLSWSIPMIRKRRTVIPYPDLVEKYLDQEANPEVRMRLALLNLVAKLDRDFALGEICDLLKVPLSTAYVWIRSWKESGNEGMVNPCRTSDRPPGRPPTLDETDLASLKMFLAEKDHWETEEVRELISRICIFRSLSHKITGVRPMRRTNWSRSLSMPITH
jgi:hypothetical protein